jgi:hypothetical protein
MMILPDSRNLLPIVSSSYSLFLIFYMQDTNSDMSTKYSGGHQQYFWEAFPTGVSDALRTTYLFTYLDAREGRPSLLELFEDYWPRLKEYQVFEVHICHAHRYPLL